MKCPYCGAEVKGNVCEYCDSELKTESSENVEDTAEPPKKKGLKSRLLKVLIGVVCVVAVLIGVGVVFKYL